ncbi:MAG: hypothetical protein Q9169_006978 [Polycauliona sp. 2 TL-2023]
MSTSYGDSLPGHNYYNNPPTNHEKVTVTDSVCLALVTLVIIARCYTKISILKAVGREDYASVVFAKPSQTKVVTNHLYIIGCTLAKFALLLFLYRIFNVSFRFRIASWILGVQAGISISTSPLRRSARSRSLT